jgi:Ca-activated chloride channel family protein
MARALLVLLVVACGGGSPEKAPAPVERRADPPQAIDATTPKPPDVMIVLDVSGSMYETDLEPDRLTATIRALEKLVDGDREERIGIVIFAMETRLHCPLTDDRETLKDKTRDLFRDLRIKNMGTAIGDALGVALDELRTAAGKHRAIILIADGENNFVTRYSPSEAAQLAKRDGVVIHTVFVGKQDDMGTLLTNPKTLTELAALTGGTAHHVLDAHTFPTTLHVVLGAIRRMAAP